VKLTCMKVIRQSQNFNPFSCWYFFPRKIMFEYKVVVTHYTRCITCLVFSFMNITDRRSRVLTRGRGQTGHVHPDLGLTFGTT
jgi:hypothetical protein